MQLALCPDLSRSHLNDDFFHQTNLIMKNLRYLLLAFTLLNLSSCQSLSSLPFGQELKLTELLGQAVPASAGAFIKFDETAKKFMGKAGCNNFNGAFTLDGGKLNLSPAAVTKKMCPDMSIENKFLPMLEKVAGFQLAQNGGLNLTDAAGKVLAKFAK